MKRSVSVQDIQPLKPKPPAFLRQLTDICPLAERLPGKALRACFLRNQDQHFGGISLPVSQRRYRILQTLLDAITVALRTRVVLKSAIVRIYRINGTPILSLDDFYEGDIVVCCCKYEPFVDVGYNVNKAHMRQLGSLIRMRGKPQPSEHIPSVCDSVPEILLDIQPCQLPQAILLYINVTRPIWQNKWSMIFEGYSKARIDKQYIIKLVDREHMSQRTKDFYYEIEILRQLQDHDNIVDLIYTVEQFKYIYIVVELLDGDLNELMRKISFSEKLVKHIMRDVSKGLAYIHSRQIVHRDLKLDNLLAQLDYSSSEYCVAVTKISDFGFATYYKGSELYECCGTPHYMAPELINYEGYDFSVDLWSLGVTLYCMLFEKLPFGGSCSKPSLIQKCVIHNNHHFPIGCEDSISAEALHLINSLLAKSPQHRLSAKEVCDHPFLLKEQIDNVNK